MHGLTQAKATFGLGRRVNGTAIGCDAAPFNSEFTTVPAGGQGAPPLPRINLTVKGGESRTR